MVVKIFKSKQLNDITTCLVYENEYYKEPYQVDYIFKTKKDAERQARKDGFKWSREDQLFLNEKEMMYRKLEIMKVSCFKDTK